MLDRDGEEMKLIIHEAEPQPEAVGAAAGAPEEPGSGSSES